MFTKKEKSAIDYFGGESEFLFLCASYKEYYENPFSNNDVNAKSNSLYYIGNCVVDKVCFGEYRKYLYVIIEGTRHKVALNKKNYESLLVMKTKLKEFHPELSDEYLNDFDFLQGIPFKIYINKGNVISLRLLDYYRFVENLSVLDKLMQ